MALTRASVTTRDGDAARRITGHLEESLEPPLAVSMFEEPAIDGWRVDAYYDTPPDRGALEPFLHALAGDDWALELGEVPDENWVAISQSALPPVAAGRFLIHGSHDRDVGRGRPLAIEIDAGEAFGTAHHATTLGCLLEIDRLTRLHRFKRVLDLGCGSGVLAIAMARTMPTARVLASDNDPQAIDVAHQNAFINGVGQRLRPVVAMGLAHPLLRRPRQFDLIVANILAGPLIAMAPRLAQAIAPGGVLVLSGILQTQAKSVLAAYMAAGMIRHRVAVHNGWVALTFAARSDRKLD